jgi:SAM-dependent methyltransferase
VCPAAAVRAQQEYLRQFHRRRLRGGPGGRLARAALADRADFTHGYATHIVACAACGLIYRNPRPPAAAIDRAYAEDSYGTERLEALFGSQRELYLSKARVLRRWLPSHRPPRVVEVGSFVGGFLAAAAEEGWEALGVDPGLEVAAFCRDRGFVVFPGTLAELRAAPGSFDVVAIWNTFDQLPDPHPTLAAARRLLRPAGVLALRMPDGAWFGGALAWLRRLPRPAAGCLRAAMAWNNLLAFPYLHGYSPRLLDRLLDRHRFQRARTCADTLGRLSDHHTRLWAAWEEQSLKTLCRAAARLAAGGPWFDAYYLAR